MNETLLIIAYGITIVASTMVGGYLPQVIRMNHVRMQVVLSFVGGMMLGVAVLILLPHGFSSIYKQLEQQAVDEIESAELLNSESAGGVDLNPARKQFSAATSRSISATMQAVLVGLLITFFMMRAFHFHQHGEEVPDHSHDGHGHTHTQELDRSHNHDDQPRSKLGWVGVVVGLGLHTFMDGLALGLAVVQDSSQLASFGVYLAILLHKPLDALSLSTLMAREKISWRVIQGANACIGLMCLVGALVALYLGEQQVSQFWLGCLLAGSAGVFLCISLSDLLPEVQFHRHDRLQLSAALLSGIAIAFIVELFHQHL